MAVESVLERRDVVLEGAARRVLHPRVLVARVLAGLEVLIGGGLIDRDADGAGRRIGRLAGVDGAGGERSALRVSFHSLLRRGSGSLAAARTPPAVIRGRSPGPRRRGRVAVLHAGCTSRDLLADPLGGRRAPTARPDRAAGARGVAALPRPEDVATRSGDWRCAARRRSASPRRSGWCSRSIQTSVTRDAAAEAVRGRGPAAARDPADRGQPALGARSRAPRWSAAARARGAGAVELRAALLDWAQRLRRADIEANLRLGEHGKTLFATGSRVLTHCNTGSLATAGYGTALGVIQSAWTTDA